MRRYWLFWMVVVGLLAALQPVCPAQESSQKGLSPWGADTHPTARS